MARGPGFDVGHLGKVICKAGLLLASGAPVVGAGACAGAGDAGGGVGVGAAGSGIARVGVADTDGFGRVGVADTDGFGDAADFVARPGRLFAILYNPFLLLYMVFNWRTSKAAPALYLITGDKKIVLQANSVEKNSVVSLN